MKKRAMNPSLALILAVSFPAPFALVGVAPALQDIADSLKSPFLFVQLLVTGFLFGMGVAQLFFGGVVDRFGRRAVLLFSLAIFAAGSLCGALTVSIGQLVAARFVQALGAAGCSVVAYTAARDISRDDAHTHKLVAYITAASEVAVIIAAPVGGRLAATFGWQSIFLLNAVLGGLLLAAAFFLFSETRGAGCLKRQQLVDLIRNYVALGRTRAFLANVFAAAAGAGAGVSILAVAPSILGKELGKGAGEVGDVLMLSGIAYVIGAVVTPRIMPRVGSTKLIIALLLSSSLLCFAFIAISLAAGTLYAGVLVVLLGLSAARAGILSLGMSAAISTKPEMAGTAAGLTSSSVAILTGVIGGLGASFYREDAVPTMAVMSAGMLAALLFYAVVYRRPSMVNKAHGGVGMAD